MLYRSYLFTDKDPIIDRMRTAFQDSGKTIKEVAQESGLTESTIRNWFYGDTERPQFASIQAFMHALGWSFEPMVLTVQETASRIATPQQMRQAEVVFKRNRERRKERMQRYTKKRATA